jgi:hypothetical protein
VKEGVQDGVLTHREASETAASVGDRKFGPSGVQKYRVLIQTAMGGNAHADVDAATGDEAAEKGLVQFPGAKVVHVAPAPKN